MCGRCCCTLDPDTLCCACEYNDATGKKRKVKWAKSELEYTPSFNKGPRDILPCVTSGSHFEGEQEERVLCAMIWGMIPAWHQGDYKKRSDKLVTHNGRLEGIQTSKLYSPSLQKRQRCIIVCDGFYEWKANINNRSPKQPYYIYAAQDKGVRSDDPTTWTNEFSETDGWKGFKVLKLAGIFGTFTTEEGKVIHSCTIITRESNQVLSWLHHRMPIYLNNEEECRIWLNTNLTTDAAIKTLTDIVLQEEILSWHPVSTIVNNVAHKTADCIKAIVPKGEKKNNQASFMASWLQKGSAASNKRKSSDNKNPNTPNEAKQEDTKEKNEEEQRPAKTRKEN